MANSRDTTRETVAALLGNAAPPPPRAVTPAPVDPEPEPEVAPEPAPAPRPKPRRVQVAPEPTPEPQPGADPPPLQTRIPSELFERARDAKEASGDTHETWFLDAFDAVYDELGDHYKPLPERRSRVPVRRRRTRRPTREPLSSYPLRLTAEERAVLEERMGELKPPSTADFVTTIVRLRLEQLGS